MMEYWSESFVAEHDVSEGESLVVRGYPAAKGNSLRFDNTVQSMYEVEIVPGSMHEGTYTEHTTFQKKRGMLVEVVYRRKYPNAVAWAVSTHVQPITWFGLTRIPNDTSSVVSAYDKAMQGI